MTGWAIPLDRVESYLDLIREGVTHANMLEFATPRTGGHS